MKDYKVIYLIAICIILALASFYYMQNYLEIIQN